LFPCQRSLATFRKDFLSLFGSWLRCAAQDGLNYIGRLTVRNPPQKKISFCTPFYTFFAPSNRRKNAYFSETFLRFRKIGQCFDLPPIHSPKTAPAWIPYTARQQGISRQIVSAAASMNSMNRPASHLPIIISCPSPYSVSITFFISHSTVATVRCRDAAVHHRRSSLSSDAHLGKTRSCPTRQRICNAKKVASPASHPSRRLTQPNVDVERQDTSQYVLPLG
jgi:hypothetical protein